MGLQAKTLHNSSLLCTHKHIVHIGHPALGETLLSKLSHYSSLFLLHSALWQIVLKIYTYGFKHTNKIETH